MRSALGIVCCYDSRVMVYQRESRSSTLYVYKRCIPLFLNMKLRPQNVNDITTSAVTPENNNR
jgi:hypothetical protein